jgi:predicted phosphodiesterase
MSDLHLEFGSFMPAATDADLVILAGDIHVKQHGITWAREHFKCPVALVAGNHEHYGNSLGRTPRKLKEAAAGSNVHVLHNEALVLDRVRILGATLWTDYRQTGNQPLAQWDASRVMNDFKKIRTETFSRLKPHHLLAEHAAARMFLEQALDTPFDGKTIVVTHHAPSGQSIHPRFRDRVSHLDASYASNLEHMAGGDRVAVWVHGHTHDSFDYDLAGMRVICNPRGYAPGHLNEEFNPGLIVEL